MACRASSGRCRRRLKLRWIGALAAAGVREIEVGSFVSPKLLPQMADAGEVVRGARSIDRLTVLALAPNSAGGGGGGGGGSECDLHACVGFARA